MAKTRATRAGKRTGKPAGPQRAFALLKTIAARLDRLEQVSTHQSAQLAVLENRDAGPKRLKPPQTPQTSARLSLEDQANAEVAAVDAAELRKRICHETRDYVLTKFEEALVGKDVAFVASCWVELLSVAVTASVDLQLPEDEQNEQIVQFLALQNHELNRRVRFYVGARRRQAAPAPTTH